MNNIPEGYENDSWVTGEDELSPEEQVALAEARDNDMDDDSDDMTEEEREEARMEDEELPDMSETTEDPLKEIGD